MIKLIITDLDGTFLDENGDYNREMFQDVKKIMSQKGVHFAICTGKLFMTKRVAALVLNLIFTNSLIKPISLFLKMPGLILPISACIKGIQSKSYRIY